MALKPMPPKCTDDEWSRMTFAERSAYAISFTPEARRIKADWELTTEERYERMRADVEAYHQAYAAKPFFETTR